MKNRVLTKEEVIARNKCPVWCEDRSGEGIWALVDSCDEKCVDADFGDWEFYCYGWTNDRGWRAWIQKPSERQKKNTPWKEEPT